MHTFFKLATFIIAMAASASGRSLLVSQDAYCLWIIDFRTLGYLQDPGKPRGARACPNCQVPSTDQG
jgi:hypothetical protein